MRKRRVYKVQDCFEFVCPELWDNLDLTDDKNIRSCISCEKSVYKATTKEKMYQLADEGKCVAFFEHERITLGLVSPTEFNINPESFKLDEVDHNNPSGSSQSIDEMATPEQAIKVMKNFLKKKEASKKKD